MDKHQCYVISVLTEKNLADCGSLNVIGSHNLIERGIRRCDFVAMDISLLEEKCATMGGGGI